MSELFSGISFLGIVMGCLALIIGFMAFYFGFNSLKWISNNKIEKDAIGFSLTIGIASIVAGIAWPVFLFIQGYEVVAVLIIISELFYIFFKLSGSSFRQ